MTSSAGRLINFFLGLLFFGKNGIIKNDTQMTSLELMAATKATDAA